MRREGEEREGVRTGRMGRRREREFWEISWRSPIAELTPAMSVCVCV